MANEKEKEVVFTEETALVELKKGYADAEVLLNDEDRFEKFLVKLENKLQVIPAVGNGLSHIPVMVSMLRSYAKKEYPELPLGTVLAVISALTYWLSPIDILPDIIPVVGQLDDAAVIIACLKLIDSDVKEYIVWRDNNKKK